jgi:hypothetical protein
VITVVTCVANGLYRTYRPLLFIYICPGAAAAESAAGKGCWAAVCAGGYFWRSFGFWGGYGGLDWVPKGYWLMVGKHNLQGPPVACQSKGRLVALPG